MQKFYKNTLLEKELSYKIAGVIISISKFHGYLYKEKIYHNLLIEEFGVNNISFIHHPAIKLYNPQNGNFMGCYFPDFLIESKIIIEVKAQNQILDSHVNQLIRYLNCSHYEVGYLVNFGTPKAQIFRRIYSNTRKPFFNNANETRITRE